jgi:hypothetical protein
VLQDEENRQARVHRKYQPTPPRSQGTSNVQRKAELINNSLTLIGGVMEMSDMISGERKSGRKSMEQTLYFQLMDT